MDVTIERHADGVTSEQINAVSYPGGELTSHLYRNPDGSFGWEIRADGIGLEGGFLLRLDETEARETAAEQLASFAETWNSPSDA